MEGEMKKTVSSVTSGYLAVRRKGWLKVRSWERLTNVVVSEQETRDITLYHLLSFLKWYHITHYNDTLGYLSVVYRVTRDIGSNWSLTS